MPGPITDAPIQDRPQRRCRGRMPSCLPTTLRAPVLEGTAGGGCYVAAGPDYELLAPVRIKIHSSDGQARPSSFWHSEIGLSTQICPGIPLFLGPNEGLSLHHHTKLSPPPKAVHRSGLGGPDVTIRATNSRGRRAFVDSGRNGRKGKAMRLQRITNGLTCTTAAAALALLLTACGPSQPAGQGSAEPGTGSPSASASQPAPETSAPPSSSSSSPSSAAPSSPSATPFAETPQATSAAAQLCKAGTLKATTDATGGGAAGSVYMELILTNTGAKTKGGVSGW